MNAHKKRKTDDGGAVALSAQHGSDHDEDEGQSLVPAASASTSSSASSLPKPRPARRQIKPERLEEIKAAADKSAQTGVTYNLWYNKWSGGDSFDSRNNTRQAETRCDIARDSGYTRADVNGGSYVCLYFARGYCPLG